MFDSLKRIAMQKLVEKMASNALSSDATSAAAENGAGAVMDSIKAKLAGGNLEEVKGLFSSGGDMQSNSLFQEAKQKMQEALQGQGMSEAEASAEAERTTPDLISGLKDKFESTDEADSEFNLESITKWLPGEAGQLLNNLGGAGDLLNKAKKLF